MGADGIALSLCAESSRACRCDCLGESFAELDAGLFDEAIGGKSFISGLATSHFSTSYVDSMPGGTIDKNSRSCFLYCSFPSRLASFSVRLARYFIA